MQQLLSRIGTALRANLGAGLVLQFFAIALGLAYYYWPAARNAFDLLATMKADYGWQYSMLATSLFGGLIPFLYLVLSKQIVTRYTAQLLFFTLFWAYRGIEVDLFYQAQAYIFGDNHEPATILKKVMFDQLVYAALWAAPTIATAYLWKESGFNFGLFKQRLTKSFMLNDVPVVIATNWLIWTPAVAVIYAMPADLQVPLFNLVLCFFVLMVAHISNRQ